MLCMAQPAIWWVAQPAIWWVAHEILVTAHPTLTTALLIVQSASQQQHQHSLYYWLCKTPQQLSESDHWSGYQRWVIIIHTGTHGGESRRGHWDSRDHIIPRHIWLVLAFRSVTCTNHASQINASDFSWEEKTTTVFILVKIDWQLDDVCDCARYAMTWQCRCPHWLVVSSCSVTIVCWRQRKALNVHS